MRKSVNEILLIVNEQFFLGLVTLIGIDDDDMLLGNDEYGISWNIMTNNIRIYYYGKEVAFLSKLNVENDQSDIDKYQYKELVGNLIFTMDNETIEEIERGLQKYVVFERFEDAQKLKNFLDQFI
jgi:hypothetical protein